MGESYLHNESLTGQSKRALCTVGCTWRVLVYPGHDRWACVEPLSPHPEGGRRVLGRVTWVPVSPPPLPGRVTSADTLDPVPWGEETQIPRDDRLLGFLLVVKF